ncbi:MAG: hypothetical protein P0Y53_19955 [Candidatus Pseudobacter hemicellulosilyticus]|uniref:Uncharacterized protein n=1 Tax=Candidatus Pseudobacter hemicellulosilyticus TaxID=3121375 RepID=A0AAJ5WQA3_9BACT|nr:MAG: hypothetical protein P0Y53_19955 [Pseudobacter sp.]
MKFVVSILLTALLSFAAGLYLDWWSIAITAFIVGLAIPQKPILSWLSAFLGLFLLWAVLAAWIDWQNQQILSRKIASILPLGGSGMALILISAFMGGLLAGFAGLTGCLARLRKRG